jgi:DNA-binding CsgD family transcriptional regulator
MTEVLGTPMSTSSRGDFAGVWARLLPNRGRVDELQRLFESSLVPMFILDNDKCRLDVNPAARLFLRTRLAEVQGGHTYDLLEPTEHAEADRQWGIMLDEGMVAGTIPLTVPDGPTIEVEYCGVANVLPGAHLVLWMPADWPDDELTPTQEADRPARTGRLTEREREVLTLLATGATLDEIADRLTLAQSTVKTHLRNALTRLGARHRAHALAIAIRDGEIGLD